MSQTILIIRHAEKPDGVTATAVDVTGAPDSKSLTPTGWQRAGAWAELFMPSLNQRALRRPTALFASTLAEHQDDVNIGASKSRRPLETITPLAAKLDLEVDRRFCKGSESELAQAISEINGVVLVCWQHEAIFAIANALTPLPQGLPTSWPGDRFNVILKFSRSDQNSQWSFEQIAPRMLAGDSTNPIES